MVSDSRYGILFFSFVLNILVRILQFFYNIFWLLLRPFLRIQLYFKAKNRPAYAQGLDQRFGTYQSNVPVDICIHAVSVGEVVAASPMVAACINANLKVLVTTMTPTGLAQAQRLFADKVVYQFLPYDFSAAINRFIDDRQFKLLLIMETELWPGLLWHCQQRGIPCFLGNARISNRSYGRYLKTKWFWSKLLSYFSGIGVQSELDRARFLSLGASDNQVFLMGNLKFYPAPIDASLLQFWQVFKQQYHKRLIWICGSTHQGEESILLDAFASLKDKFPELLLVLVPRHPERFEDVATLIRDNGFAYLRLSQCDVLASDVDVILLDKMGELSVSYVAADLAFVGGSLVPIGGHNILEPLFFKVAVMCGPHMHNQQDLLRILKEQELIELVCPENLVAIMDKYISNHELRQHQGEKGFALMQDHKGAKDMLWAHIRRLLV
ncbi:MAG: 3-deoxy-D-manno-octulosonic acid transferase [Gammaproteobacteria bacterium]|nr:3-deoxy-D-manno-octulosonic acid transferase [Gammaproteobacteria bacterium]